MKDRRDTRRTLWRQNSEELIRAQEYDAEALRHSRLKIEAEKNAALCRARAVEFVKAAEELAELDARDGIKN